MKEVGRRRLAMALALSPGIGGKTLTRILTRCDLFGIRPEEFLRLGPEALTEEFRVKRSAAQDWDAGKKARLQDAEQLQKRLDPLGVRMVTAADGAYPFRLEQLDPDPPGILFLYGNLRLLEASSFAVLGSRNSSEASLREMERLTEEGVLQGQSLVSGHDTPEYQRSAVVPLRWGAPRILVLDQGLFPVLGPDLREEPFRAARLWRFQFDPQTDLVVSFQHPDRTYHRNANRMRDRVVAGLALRLDLVQTSPGGMMQSLAKLALKAGRPVRVSPLSEGHEALMALGAKLLPLSA